MERTEDVYQQIYLQFIQEMGLEGSFHEYLTERLTKYDLTDK